MQCAFLSFQGGNGFGCRPEAWVAIAFGSPAPVISEASDGMWVYRLRKLARLSTPELVLLLQAQWALLRASARLRFQSPGRIVSAASDDAAAPAAEVDTAELARARAVEQAIMRAARHGLVRPLCLARSLALQSMLEAWRIGGSRVRVGVQLEDGAFTAHAWVEYCGLVLGDTRTHVNGYVPLDRARVRASR